MDRRAWAHLILVGMPENAATIGRNGGEHLILISSAKTSFTRSLGPKLEFCPGKGYDSMVQRCGNKRRIVGKGCDSRQPRRCDQERHVMHCMTDNRKGSLICRLEWSTTADECSSRRWIRVVDNGSMPIVMWHTDFDSVGPGCNWFLCHFCSVFHGGESI